MKVRDSPPKGRALEHDRATSESLLVAEVKCRNRGVCTDLFDSEIFWNESLGRVDRSAPRREWR
jgi:hypothetical protein